MPWPHAPDHWLFSPGIYMVTAGTLGKHRILASPAHLDLVQDRLFEACSEFSWHLEAWAVLANHYHFVARSPADPGTLCALVRKLHSCTARELNRIDGARGRRVWFQFWDSHITYEKSYLARLAYVHNNPVHHGIVVEAREYRWCSAAWFETNATKAFRETLRSVPTDRVNVVDDF
jgi:putative transposase